MTRLTAKETKMKDKDVAMQINGTQSERVRRLPHVAAGPAAREGDCNFNF